MLLLIPFLFFRRSKFLSFSESFDSNSLEGIVILTQTADIISEDFDYCKTESNESFLGRITFSLMNCLLNDN